MTTETMITEIYGTPFPDILVMRWGRSFCRAMAKSALDPPKMLDMTTEAVANRAAIEIYASTKGFWVATRRAVSRGASDVAITDQSTSPMATIDTPM